MLHKNKENILFQIYFEVDEMNKNLDSRPSLDTEDGLVNHPRGPKCRLSDSEIMTILCFYHVSGFKNFQYYYEQMVLSGDLKAFFPNAVSYNRFVELIPRIAQRLNFFAKLRCFQSEQTGIYFADSKKLPVCDNKRIKSNQVFKDVGGRGKSSTGWFYGLKVHLVVNNIGQIMSFCFTAANVSDNDNNVLDCLFKSVKGKCFADKGYLTKKFEHFYEKGIQIITKIRKNMKNTLMQFSDKLWLRKRAMIESINDLLMTICDIDHSRHRNPWNAVVHGIAGLIAYSYYETKPSVFIPNEFL